MCTPTQFLGDPVKAKGELLDLDDQVVGERGKAGGSGKRDAWNTDINAHILRLAGCNPSVHVAASSNVLGSSSLGLNGWAPEVCEHLWFIEGGHAGGEGDFGAHGGSRVALLTLAFRLLKLLCERMAHDVFNPQAVQPRTINCAEEPENRTLCRARVCCPLVRYQYSLRCHTEHIWRDESSAFHQFLI